MIFFRVFYKCTKYIMQTTHHHVMFTFHMFIIPSHSSNFGAGCGPEKIMYTYNTNTAYMYVRILVCCVVVAAALAVYLSTLLTSVFYFHRLFFLQFSLQFSTKHNCTKNTTGRLETTNQLASSPIT